VVADPKFVGVEGDSLLEAPVVLGGDETPFPLTGDEVSGGDDEAL
jgi:hypothetical protein